MGTLEGKIARGRFGTPDEITKAMVFLASGDASDLTGAERFADDGCAQV